MNNIKIKLKKNQKIKHFLLSTPETVKFSDSLKIKNNFNEAIKNINADSSTGRCFVF